MKFHDNHNPVVDHISVDRVRKHIVAKRILLRQLSSREIDQESGQKIRKSLLSGPKEWRGIGSEYSSGTLFLMLTHRRIASI